MKKITFVLGVVFAVIFAACSKDDNNGIVLQDHDQNRMMDSMHAMMSRMQAMTMTMDPDIDFAEMMMMHHQGAINMAQVELSAGTNDSLKSFAQKVINDQQAEIMQLESILSTLTVDNMDMEFMQEQMDNMDKTEKAADVQIITGDVDNDFATLMMIHHQAAIDDASGYLHHGSNIELKAIATNIVTAQTMEIQELADWLKANRR
ncbi:MAG TPA: DUF305 domain-containing protein [Parafilimonas sp.]|nr:DUF305 domain-containing protein [Parafilimonas sp.]